MALKYIKMVYYIGKDKIEGTETCSIEELVRVLKKEKVIGLDTETKRKGISPLKNDILDHEIVMLQISTLHNQWVLDVRNKELLDYIKPFLQSNKLLKVGHNIKFDYIVLRNENIILENIYDTMIIEQVLNTGYSKPVGFYSLEQTFERYEGYSPYSNQLDLFKPIISKSIRSKIGEKEIFELPDILYGAEDAKSVLNIYLKQAPIIEQNKMRKLMLLENEFVLVLGDMEYNGMPINIDKWIDLNEWAKVEISKVLEKLQAEVPEVENWNSAKQVTKAFKILGINTKTRDKKTGLLKDSVNETVIKEQAINFPIIDIYLKYKGLQKIESSYGVKFLKNVSPITGRIHTSFIQILSTGRTASTSPNMQNIITGSKEFPEGIWWREAFQPKKGNKFVIADFNSQEVRVCADKSKDAVMLDALRHGKDLHKLSAAALYNKPVEEITDTERKNGKIARFAIMYGAGGSNLAKTFGVPRKLGETMINGFYKMHPAIKKMQDNSFKFALKNGYISIDSFGRRSYVETHPRIKILERVKHLNPE